MSNFHSEGRRLPPIPIPPLEHPHHHHHHMHSRTPASTSNSNNPPPHYHHHHVHAHPSNKKEKDGESGAIPSRKRSRQEDPAMYLPANDRNSWYYPALLREDSEEDEEQLTVGVRGGNWGKKRLKGARWVRKGKIAAWGPGKDEYDMEERARQRIKRLLPQPPRSPSPPRLPHLRSPTPPLCAPYAPPITQHTSFTSFVLDPSISHSFRSGLISDLERSAGELIEGEAELNRAFGRLWRVLSTQDEGMPHELFVTQDSIPLPPIYDSTHVLTPHMQYETVEKSLAILRDLQDDGRECVERLEEIRENLGAIRGVRKGVWSVVRMRALEEMERGL